MIASENDLILRYSGGLFNNDPVQSLGGSMSNVNIVSNTIDNLFDGVVSLSDIADYRAIYIINNHDTDSFFNVKCWLENVNQTGSEISVGTFNINERQKISFLDYGNISNGSFVLKIGKFTTGQIIWDNDINVVAENIKTAINESPMISGTMVESTDVTNDVGNIYLTFEDQDKNTSHPILRIVSQDLNNNPDILISIIQKGSPINDIAMDIEFDNNSPFEITFTKADFSTPIEIGCLRPGYAFFLWFKREFDYSAGSSLHDTQLVESSYSLRISAHVEA